MQKALTALAGLILLAGSVTLPELTRRVVKLEGWRESAIEERITLQAKIDRIDKNLGIVVCKISPKDCLPMVTGAQP